MATADEDAFLVRDNKISEHLVPGSMLGHRELYVPAGGYMAMGHCLLGMDSINLFTSQHFRRPPQRHLP